MEHRGAIGASVHGWSGREYPPLQQLEFTLDTSLLTRDQASKGNMLDHRHRQSYGLSDITNVVLGSSRGGIQDEAKIGRGLTLPTKLQSNSFCDPSLIDDGVRHSDKNRRDWVDVDKLNEDDPQACSAYASAIFQHLREAELTKRPSSRYLDHVQADVNAKMRAILVDWLVEVTEEYRLCADTLYQSINFLDRFLSAHHAPRSQLQLIGVTCMWVSAKYEEIYPPTVSDFCYITDNTYDKSELIEMEEIVLKTLDYQLTVPTAKTFLRRLLQVCNPDEYLHYLSNYLTELSLLDYGMLRFLPSLIAAAAVYLANLMLKRQPWDANLRHYSTYMPSDISSCVLALSGVHQAVSSNMSLGSIRDKYRHARFHEVSRIPAVTVSAQMLV